MLLSNEEYIERGGNVCMCCGAKSLSAGYIDSSETNAWSSVTCNVCGSGWTDVYELKSYENVSCELDLLTQLKLKLEKTFPKAKTILYKQNLCSDTSVHFVEHDRLIFMLVGDPKDDRFKERAFNSMNQPLYIDVMSIDGALMFRESHMQTDAQKGSKLAYEYYDIEYRDDIDQYVEFAVTLLNNNRDTLAFDLGVERPDREYFLNKYLPSGNDGKKKITFLECSTDSELDLIAEAYELERNDSDDYEVGVSTVKLLDDGEVLAQFVLSGATANGAIWRNIFVSAKLSISGKHES